MAIPRTPGNGAVTIEWSYQPPITSFADAGGPDTGVVPGLVEDATAAEALRAAWLESQVAGDDALQAFDTEGSELSYSLYARDVLPFEKDDSWGGVELP